jgi:2-polyprenyl-6-hydroxyphenyl methylase/3-demethylubiquinone-9 3-methyltransferase
MTHSVTLDTREHDHFEALGQDWWKARGPLMALHDLVPARMAFIKQAVGSLKGKTVLDIGCGGGLLAEPLTRLGAKVTGLDASAEAIRAAKTHAKTGGLEIGYHTGTIESLPKNMRFDVVLASEILEHVADAGLFVREATKRVKPDGMFIATTLNRTFKSLALGVMLAERVFHLAPQGTHDWKKFIKPSELAAHLRDSGFEVGGLSGLHYNPLLHEARLASHDLAVNYLLWAKRAG